MNAISGDELAAVIAALQLYVQREPSTPPERPSAWKLAMRRESVTPFDE